MSASVLLAETPRGEQRVLASEWIPVEQAALCLETGCEAIFRIQTACPACASRTWVLLARWLNGGTKGDGTCSCQ